MKSTWTYEEQLAFATEGLPTHLDYVKYLGVPNKANQYSRTDILFARDVCKTVASKLLIK